MLARWRFKTIGMTPQEHQPITDWAWNINLKTRLSLRSTVHQDQQRSPPFHQKQPKWHNWILFLNISPSISEKIQFLWNLTHFIKVKITSVTFFVKSKRSPAMSAICWQPVTSSIFFNLINSRYISWALQHLWFKHGAPLNINWL